LPTPATKNQLGGPVLFPVLLLVVCAVVGWRTLGVDLLADDFGYLQLFGSLSLGAAVSPGDVSHGIWGQRLDEMRPAFGLFSWLAVRLLGTDPHGHHVLNAVLHAACTLLVYALVRALAGRALTALLAGALFALAPVHAEAVAWITGRVDLLPSVLFLASALGFLVFRQRGSRLAYALSVSAFALGVFAKEIVLTLPLLLVAIDRHLGRDATGSRDRVRLKAYLPYVALAATVLLLRLAAFGSAAREERLRPGLLLAFAFRQVRNLGLLLAPEEGGLPLRAVALLLLAAWGIVLFRHRAAQARAVRVVLMGAAWYAVTLLPLAVTYASLRHLYLPSVGIAIVVAVVVLPATEAGVRATPLRLATAALLVALSADGLVRRVGEWAAAGAVSRALRAEAVRLAPSIPDGSLLVLEGIPAHTGKAFVWQWALPFALQPPFVAPDVYGRFRVLEPLDVYCCPAAAWWQRKGPIVDALVHGAADEPVVVLRWRGDERRLQLEQRRLAGADVRRLAEGLAGPPP
jgi:protein O-mannosyl-transferase